MTLQRVRYPWLCFKVEPGDASILKVAPSVSHLHGVAVPDERGSPASLFEDLAH